MKQFIKTIFFVLIICLSGTLEFESNNVKIGIDIACGKEEPEKNKHCTKYGTGSGMVCCFFRKTEGATPSCVMMSDDKARSFGIAGEKKFDDGEYWDCGNGSNNNKIIPIILIALCVLLI